VISYSSTCPFRLNSNYSFRDRVGSRSHSGHIQSTDNNRRVFPTMNINGQLI
jgi:hypothetical protein